MVLTVYERDMHDNMCADSLTWLKLSSMPYLLPFATYEVGPGQARPTGAQALC